MALGTSLGQQEFRVAASEASSRIVDATANGSHATPPHGFLITDTWDGLELIVTGCVDGLAKLFVVGAAVSLWAAGVGTPALPACDALVTQPSDGQVEAATAAAAVPTMDACDPSLSA